MFLNYDSHLRCEVSGIGGLPLGEKALSFPSLEMLICDYSLSSPFNSCIGSQSIMLLALILVLS